MSTSRKERAANTIAKRRNRVPLAEARLLLIDATIDLLRRTPFDQVSWRLIAEAADLNQSTVLRAFGSTDELFSQVSLELLRRTTERIERGLSESVLVDRDAVLRTRLLVWLLIRGVDPSPFVAKSDDAPFQLLVQRLQDAVEITPRTAIAFNELVAYAAEAAMVLSPVHIQDEGVEADTIALVSEFLTRLPEIEKSLGWDH